MMRASVTSIKRLKAVFKVAMQDGLLLTAVGTMLISGSVSAYALTQFDKPQSINDERLALSIDTSETTFENAEDPSDADKDSAGDQGREKNTTDSARQNPDGSPGADQSYGTPPDNSQRIIASATSLSLGGAEGDSYAYSNIRYASGSPIESSLSFSKTPSFTGESAISFNGLVVNESALTNGTAPEVIRTVVVNQTNPDSSGSTTFYVFTSMMSGPLPIKVTWQPMPSYSIMKTGQTRVDTGDTVIHTFSLRIDPNQYFGHPSVNITSHGAALHRCGAGSAMSVQAVYNGVKNFTLRCVVQKPSCVQPCPLVSETIITLGISAQTPAGTFIPGGSSLQYNIPKMYEFVPA